MDRPGYFIAIEGIAGVGKTTACQFAEEYLRSRYVDVVVTKVPGDTAFGLRCRELLLSDVTGETDHTVQAMIFCAARRQLVQSVIKPALARGAIVLSDRYTLSTLAYQYNAEGLDTLTELSTAGLKPDHTILLDGPVEMCHERLMKRTDVRELSHLDRSEYNEIKRRREIMLNWYYANADVSTTLCVNTDVATVKDRMIHTLETLLFSR